MFYRPAMAAGDLEGFGDVAPKKYECKLLYDKLCIQHIDQIILIRFVVVVIHGL